MKKFTVVDENMNAIKVVKMTGNEVNERDDCYLKDDDTVIEPDRIYYFMEFHGYEDQVWLNQCDIGDIFI